MPVGGLEVLEDLAEPVARRWGRGRSGSGRSCSWPRRGARWWPGRRPRMPLASMIGAPPSSTTDRLPTSRDRLPAIFSVSDRLVADWNRSSAVMQRELAPAHAARVVDHVEVGLHPVHGRLGEARHEPGDLADVAHLDLGGGDAGARRRARLACRRRGRAGGPARAAARVAAGGVGPPGGATGVTRRHAAVAGQCAVVGGVAAIGGRIGRGPAVGGRAGPAAVPARWRARAARR